MKKTLLLFMTVSMMLVFALINVNPSVAQAQELPYELTLPESLETVKKTVKLQGEEYDTYVDRELEFIVVPDNSKLSITPKADFAATVSIYSPEGVESDGKEVYFEGPFYWEVANSSDVLNYVEANTTATATFKYNPDLKEFFELNIREEGYEKSIYFIVQEPGKTTAPTKEPVAEAVPQEVTATSTAANVLVNGSQVAFEAYNIDGNNYFKLRDLAQALKGASKQFGVSWDAEYNTIRLSSDGEYETIGGELAASEDKTARKANPTGSMIIINGQEAKFTAYNIDGNNYFKLRDIAQAFNIGTTWDEASKTIGIDTSIDYIPE